ncbi:MAG: AMP-binding protein [Deltaproteobacteria bacterium]|nr:AMP-binding protein [Deltaproteobacteria bacterium]
MLVHNFLEYSAGKSPGKAALVINNERHTYADINAMADRLAYALVAEGFERGDRAVVFLENTLEAVVSIFAILKAGGAFLPVNPGTKGEKLAYILNNSRASALISSNQKTNVINEVCGATPFLRMIVLAGNGTAWNNITLNKKIISFGDITESSGTPSLPCVSIDADLASILYTSGSTGRPKGVALTHLNMVSAADSITTYLENTSDDIIINVLPLSFDYGLYQVLMAFKVGATVILEKSFIYPWSIIDTILREKVTGFPIVPMISAILMQIDDIKQKDFSHLRYITNTAASLPDAHIKKLREFFPKTKIFSMYGLTECKRVSYLPTEDLEKRPGSVGKAMPNTETYVVDEDGKKVGPGVIGELVVRGSNVMRGYWESPEETARVIKTGAFPGDVLLYTGDNFVMDEAGYLYFKGRKDDVIKSRGEKVSPKEIENVLYGIKGVAEAAVIGVPDPILGESIKAFIVRSEHSLTERDVLTFCSTRLEDLLVPKEIVFVDELPKTENGKINKALLKQMPPRPSI